MNSHRSEIHSHISEENRQNNIKSNSLSKTHRSASVRIKDSCNTARFKRPETPHINLFLNQKDQNENNSCEEEIKVRSLRTKANEPENIIKNFSSFMKNIIETQNDNFLSGDTKVIEFIMTKYLNMDWEDIKQMKKLSIKINSDFGLLNQFGEHLPNLKELKLNNSVLNSISDVGTSFKNLVILNVMNCSIKDLSGIICFSQLEVLYAQDNSISDLIELEMCSSIQKLNLKNNLVQDEENIQFLSNLTDLKWLNLCCNPISNNKNYQELIKDNLPWLEALDKEEEKTLLEDESINIINDDKRFFESQSTFSNSPCSQKTNNRPISSYTSSNFFNSNQKLKISEDISNLVEQGEDSLIKEINISNLNLMSKTNNKNFFNNGKRLQTAKLKLNSISKNESPEKIQDNHNDLSPHKPWNLPDNPVFNFNLQSETARGKSQNPLTKKELSQTMTAFTGFNKNTCNINSNQTSLRPIMVKKDKPIEIKSFKKTVEDDLISQEIMKNLDKHTGKSFKLNPFSENKGNVSLMKNLIPNKDAKPPLKLKVINKTLNPLKKDEEI